MEQRQAGGDEKAMGGTKSTRSQTAAPSREDENDNTSDHGNKNRGSYRSIADHECNTNDNGANTLPPPGSPIRGNSKKEKITYTELLRKNTNFRYFLLSYVINHMVSEQAVNRESHWKVFYCSMLFPNKNHLSFVVLAICCQQRGNG